PEMVNAKLFDSLSAKAFEHPGYRRIQAAIGQAGGLAAAGREQTKWADRVLAAGDDDLKPHIAQLLVTPLPVIEGTDIDRFRPTSPDRTAARAPAAGHRRPRYRPLRPRHRGPSVRLRPRTHREGAALATAAAGHERRDWAGRSARPAADPRTASSQAEDAHVS